MHKIDNYLAISEYNKEIDLIGLEKRIREFVNNGDNIQGKETLKYKNCTIMLPLALLEPN